MKHRAFAPGTSKMAELLNKGIPTGPYSMGCWVNPTLAGEPNAEALQNGYRAFQTHDINKVSVPPKPEPKKRAKAPLTIALGTKPPIEVTQCAAFKLIEKLCTQTATRVLGFRDLIVLLNVPHDGPIQFRDLASNTKLNNPSMARRIANLQRNSLIVTYANPSDKRDKLISFTPKGLALINDIVNS